MILVVSHQIAYFIISIKSKILYGFREILFETLFK